MTKIYQIRCKDEKITNNYVSKCKAGSLKATTRRHENNSASNSFNQTIKLYKTIRLNGGWNNW